MKKLLDRLLKRGNESAPQAKQPASAPHEIALQHVRRKLKEIPDEPDKTVEPSMPAAERVRDKKAARGRNKDQRRRKAKEDPSSSLVAEKPRRRRKRAREDLPSGFAAEKPGRREKKGLEYLPSAVAADGPGYGKNRAREDRPYGLGLETPKRRKKKAKEDQPSGLGLEPPKRRKKKAKEDLPYDLRAEKPTRRRKKKGDRVRELGGGESTSRPGKKPWPESFI